ncbi:hypothetical protein F9802_15830 [Bacillus aerolatus]|uniref:Uncharacterized protein n=1 Tax=Bacillus aerolatus TaxID=2653354 RepID=A0A6I1FHS0_9BACI|nr:hypothetical protein [Bacillus aerolatus]KAB7705027.1 hypothetical protein F9802_15830 [Bacillus aerolatus]
MDNWNRRREYRIMNCPEYAQRERIEEEQRKGQQAKKELHLKELSEAIRTSFEGSYMNNWVSCFRSIRSKREAWKLTSSIGVENSSLSSLHNLKYFFYFFWGFIV